MVDLELPIPVSPHLDESGLGYCLRAATANGTTIAALRRLLNIGENERIGRQHAFILARVFGCSETWLAQALVDRTFRKDSPRLAVYRHAFRSLTALRLRSPQLCEMCLTEHDYLQSVWDLSLYTVCIRHQVELVSVCRHCRRGFKWSRPAATWCACGRFLGTSEGIVSDDGPLVLANQVIGRSFTRTSNIDTLRGSGLFDWLILSPTGWHDLLMALGLVEKRFVQPPRGTHLAAPSSENARKIASRGMRRLLSLSQGELDPQQLAPLISIPFLRGLVEIPGAPEDRQVGLQLFHLLYGEDGTASLRNAHPTIAQRDLFSETP